MADDARLPLPLEQDLVPAPGPLRLTPDEYDLLIETGFAQRLGRIELRGGELWRISPQHAPHMWMKLAVYGALALLFEEGPH